ncbi:hypothetical protein [Agromyces sp. LHK192]|uniref:hypothetical protein n=1 Tax=Agromyces sp. LHK192 TaxID=2498704 RepID=UPI000FD7B258|nr:hypothetical protein [Agromyces sp. LHK192]
MTAATDRRRRRSEATRGKVGAALLGRPVALFGEVVVVGLLVALFVLPIVTAPAALAAGAAHLRRHLRGEPDRITAFLLDLITAFRQGWVWCVGIGLAGFAVVFNLTAPATSEVPGGEVVRWASIVFAFAGLIVVLRAAAGWTPGERWSDLIRGSAVASVADPLGSLMIAVACGMCGLIVWMFAPLIVLVPGLLVLAALAVTWRVNSPRP